VSAVISQCELISDGGLKSSSLEEAGNDDKYESCLALVREIGPQNIVGSIWIVMSTKRSTYKTKPWALPTEVVVDFECCRVNFRTGDVVIGASGGLAAVQPCMCKAGFFEPSVPIRAVWLKLRSCPFASDMAK
jgi:hypothetical protein